MTSRFVLFLKSEKPLTPCLVFVGDMTFFACLHYSDSFWQDPRKGICGSSLKEAAIRLFLCKAKGQQSLQNNHDVPVQI